jgi:hypothetical protein
MKMIFISTLLMWLLSPESNAQEIQTLFKGTQPSGGYGALSNKFTTINGEYANLAEIYGGWFIRKRFLLGIGAAATTNNLRVPIEYSADPLKEMSWEYGQCGLMTEYVFRSNRVIHFNFTLFAGAGFTVQYERTDLDEWDNHDFDHDHDMEHDPNFFYVMEPGGQLELNLFKWMRLSPGISYRKAFGSNGIGLDDADLSNLSYNLTLKFGKF